MSSSKIREMTNCNLKHNVFRNGVSGFSFLFLLNLLFLISFWLPTKTFSGQIVAFHKKSELKIGESSAFFTYVKSSLPKGNNQDAALLQENVTRNLMTEEKLNASDQQRNACGEIPAPETKSHVDDCPSNTSIPDSFSIERSCTPPFPLEFSQGRHSNEFCQAVMQPRSESHHDVSGFHPHGAYPYYIPGVMNQVVMPPSPMYQKNMPDLHNHTSIIPQYSHIPQCSPHMPGMASFPCYPVGICLQPSQMPTTHHPWPSYGSSSPAEGKSIKVDRREAALKKFRQKRKDRCFNKKIRYVNRKKLAEGRPRVRGQFVRKVNGVNVDLNGLPASADEDYDEEDDEDDDSQVANMDSSPGDDASMCQRWSDLPGIFPLKRHKYSYQNIICAINHITLSCQNHGWNRIGDSVTPEEDHCCHKGNVMLGWCSWYIQEQWTWTDLKFSAKITHAGVLICLLIWRVTTIFSSVSFFFSLFPKCKNLCSP